MINDDLDKLMRKKVAERQELTCYELPNLIHKILSIELVIDPSIQSIDCVNASIDVIKKITNAECESALSYYNKLKS